MSMSHANSHHAFCTNSNVKCDLASMYTFLSLPVSTTTFFTLFQWQYTPSDFWITIFHVTSINLHGCDLWGIDHSYLHHYLRLQLYTFKYELRQNYHEVLSFNNLSEPKWYWWIQVKVLWILKFKVSLSKVCTHHWECPYTHAEAK